MVFPSNAQDAAGLLRTAIRCDDPVLFCEHKHLYRQTYNKGAVSRPRLHDAVRQGGGRARRRRRRGVHLGRARAALAVCRAAGAERDGISVAVVDLRTIVPYDWETIAAYTQRTSRVVVAHEDQLTCGFGAEIAARIADELFEYLDAPVKRVAALDTPVAYAPVLEEAILPGSADVLAAIRTVAQVLSAGPVLSSPFSLAVGHAWLLAASAAHDPRPSRRLGRIVRREAITPSSSTSTSPAARSPDASGSS